MTSKFVRILVAALFSLSLIAWRRPLRPVPPLLLPLPPQSQRTFLCFRHPAATGTKVGTISIEGAIFGSNEGRRDIDALTKKLERNKPNSRP